MAFINPVFQKSTSFIRSIAAKEQAPVKLPRISRKSSYRTNAFTDLSCLARSHPYGSGGVNPSIDWTGYDEEALQKEYEEAKKYLENPDAEDEEYSEQWFSVVKPAMIKENQLHRESNLPADWEEKLNFPEEFTVYPLLKGAVRIEIQEKYESLWMIASQPGGDIAVEKKTSESDEFVYLMTSDRKSYMCFTMQSQVEQFLFQLKKGDDRYKDYQVVERKLNDIESMSTKFSTAISFVLPYSFIEPSALELV